jgi:hypothetical protein
LNEWINKNGDDFGIPNGKLIENEDFRLSISCNESCKAATTSCSCGINIQLGSFRGNFSLSNFYKHLKSKKRATKKKRISGSVDNDESNEIVNQTSIDSETLQSGSTIEHIQPLTSTITTDSPVLINKSCK